MERDEGASDAYEAAGLQILELAHSAYSSYVTKTPPAASSKRDRFDPPERLRHCVLMQSLNPMEVLIAEYSGPLKRLARK